MTIIWHLWNMDEVRARGLVPQFCTPNGFYSERALRMGYHQYGSTAELDPDDRIFAEVYMPAKADTYRIDFYTIRGGVKSTHLVSFESKTLRGIMRRVPRLLIIAALMKI